MRRKGLFKVLLKNNLKKIRQRRGITQYDVANRCNINLDTYYRIEQGKAEPLLGTAFLIANVLGETVDRLFYLDKEKSF